ncbi:STAS/SEC14 domain-containing protein [Hymenobacter convexus]|uniref:STAS/SEC14 domain-containing protein n=1 Tax=Hymenobacter sp. CA1UV-4 TaxID=3063782 RepID=UPI002713D8E2|nr:STAS/SEC14 domain-containing protein [Hymenobacter sp. CA1UV-4]MDO7853040.1 STAS/SEC14 domain-containing protein [Hymenobacter sp. CA1UV-4]
MKKELTNSFDKVYLTIEFDAANSWIYNNWRGVLPTEKVIQGCQATIDFLRENPCPHMLNDNREVVGSWSAANEWIAHNWMPQVLRLGLKRFAHIVSPGIFGQASAAEMVTRVGTQFEMRLFEDIELAKSWLREG